MNCPSVNVLYWEAEDSSETVILGVYDSYEGCQKEVERLKSSEYYLEGNFIITGSFWIRNDNDDILYGDLEVLP